MKRTVFFIIFSILGAMSVPAFAELPPESEWKEEGVCARVRIQISQDAAITRTAFKATLEIDNSPENVAIENLKVSLDIRNEAQEPSNTLFGIRDPELTDIDDVDGTGIIEPGGTAKAVWIIIPTRDAAPDAPTRYYVGGTLSYTESGQQISMPLFPASITVRPDPKLLLHYFLQRVVYSDDPFTKDIIEPEEPFPLGLILSNQGKGTAHHVKITSSQPKIIENEKGLLIDFKIIGTQVNTEEITPSLTTDFGEIGPGKTGVAKWMMTASLQGKFIEYEAKFEHVDDLGDPRLSLIDSVSIHELLHAVRMDFPDDDERSDFLVNDVQDNDFMPDTVYSSDGSASAVNLAVNPAISSPVTADNLEVTLTASASDGWVYIRTDDPGQETFVLKKVVRSDGKEIRLEDNAWTTHRTIRLIGEEPYRQNLLHVFDYSESGNCQYTLFYENRAAVPQPPVLMFIPDRSFPEGLHFGFLVRASDPNGTAPTVTAEPLPDGSTFIQKSSYEWYFDWATKAGDAGKYEILFTASDGELTDSQTATVIIYSDADTDGDGMPDDWEQAKFGTLDNDGTSDSDGNGISDLDDYLLETGPSLANAYELTLAVSPAGTGTTTPSAGVYRYSENETVMMEANPASGYKFDHWTGEVANAGTAATSVTMDKSKTVTAHFISVSPPDSDGDGTPDISDQCPWDPNKIYPGVCGCGVAETDCTYIPYDLCPNDPNKTDPGICGCGIADTDSNSNGIADCKETTQDLCPDDPNKTAPGICGCGIVDIDSNGNGIMDCKETPQDLCPDDPNKTDPGICGCGIADTDSNSNGIADCLENQQDFCPDDSSKTLPGVCGCGTADTDSSGNGIPDCLDIPDVLKDSDGDGTPDITDECPADPYKITLGVCGCGIADTDRDGDMTPDCYDNCPDDPKKVLAGVCGCGIADTDSNGNGIPDCADKPAAETDTDNDGTPDSKDQCLSDPAKILPGICGCGVSDADSDSDKIPDCMDQCPFDPQKTELGLCGCGIADTDTDNDGTPDCFDNCPENPYKTNPGIEGCGISGNAPIADAGEDQTVQEGSLVRLRGSAVNGSFADLTYRWTRIGTYPAWIDHHSLVSLSDPADAKATFAAPQVGEEDGSITFRLTISDTLGNSSSDTCIIRIVNEGPGDDGGGGGCFINSIAKFIKKEYCFSYFMTDTTD